MHCDAFFVGSRAFLTISQSAEAARFRANFAVRARVSDARAKAASISLRQPALRSPIYVCAISARFVP